VRVSKGGSAGLKLGGGLGRGVQQKKQACKRIPGSLFRGMHLGAKHGQAMR
jgi:hypothetical protein